MKQLLFTLLCLLGVTASFAQNDSPWQGKFEQLGTELPTPNIFRAADGAPGPQYWQQKADYKLNVQLDDEQQRISGKGQITYYNQSPQPLNYLWVQLDQNRRAPGNMDQLSRQFKLKDSLTTKSMVYNLSLTSTEGGMHITSATDNKGKALRYTINNTMMRIDLDNPLMPGESYEFELSWWYNLNNRMEEFGRSGFEYFPEDGNYVYTIAQFYPRMAVYDDYEGWQNKQFMGGGEFALTFGDFEVEITVPKDHLVAATGILQNAKKVLSKTQYQKYEQAKQSFDKPVIIASQAEAEKREKSRSKKQQTWTYKSRECTRLCLCQLSQIYLGCTGCSSR